MVLNFYKPSDVLVYRWVREAKRIDCEQVERPALIDYKPLKEKG